METIKGIRENISMSDIVITPSQAIITKVEISSILGLFCNL